MAGAGSSIALVTPSLGLTRRLGKTSNPPATAAVSAPVAACVHQTLKFSPFRPTTSIRTIGRTHGGLEHYGELQTQTRRVVRAPCAPAARRGVLRLSLPGRAERDEPRRCKPRGGPQG